MAAPLVVGQSLQEWFRGMVAEVITQRRLEVRAETEFYLVDLLARSTAAGPPAEPGLDEPLALLLLQALQAGRRERTARLRQVGDTSLFVSGFFGDSLARRLVGPGYYRAMGQRAYGALADGGPGATAPVYADLAEHFGQFADLYAEIAELADLRSDRGLLRLYERWQLTRSERVARLLRDRGVALFSGPGAPPGGLRH